MHAMEMMIVMMAPMKVQNIVLLTVVAQRNSAVKTTAVFPNGGDVTLTMTAGIKVMRMVVLKRNVIPLKNLGKPSLVDSLV